MIQLAELFVPVRSESRPSAPLASLDFLSSYIEYQTIMLYSLGKSELLVWDVPKPLSFWKVEKRGPVPIRCWYPDFGLEDA